MQKTTQNKKKIIIINTIPFWILVNWAWIFIFTIANFKWAKQTSICNGKYELNAQFDSIQKGMVRFFKAQFGIYHSIPNVFWILAPLFVYFFASAAVPEMTYP